MNQRLLASMVLVGAVGLKPREGDIHDPLLRGFEDYMRLGFNDETRFDSMFGPEVPIEIYDLWDHSREMTGRLNWKPWMFSWELPNLLSAVRTETLVIWGRHDRVVPLECGRQYVELLPNSRLEIVEESGHNVDLEKPDELARLISHFCGQAR